MEEAAAAASKLALANARKDAQEASIEAERPTRLAEGRESAGSELKGRRGERGGGSTATEAEERPVDWAV